MQRLGVLLHIAIGEALATWITSGTPPPGLAELSPGRFGRLPDDVLLDRGLWQYADDYDPTAPDPGSTPTGRPRKGMTGPGPRPSR